MTFDEELREFQEGQKEKKEKEVKKASDEEDLKRLLLKINEKTHQWEKRLTKLDSLRRKIIAELRQFNSE